MLITQPCKPISRATMNNLVWLSKIARSARFDVGLIKISWIWWIDIQNKMIKSINTSILKLFKGRTLENLSGSGGGGVGRGTKKIFT